MKHEEIPTKEQMWKLLVKQIEENINNTWKAGYYAGRYDSITTGEEVILEDLSK